jgi:hypothetical protein
MDSMAATRPERDECSGYSYGYIELVPQGDVIAFMQSQQASLGECMAAIGESHAVLPPAPGEWSAKQVLLHLIDTERLFGFRALWFARGERSALPGMQPDPWIAITDANARPASDLLDEWAYVRAATVHLFAHLDDQAWLRRGSASDAIVSVRALAWIVAGHTLHHERSLRAQHLEQQF